MGVFDLFGKSEKTRRDRTEEVRREPIDVNKGGPVSVFEPTSYQDVEKIIDALKDGKNAVVHLEKLKPETAIRVLDMLSGAIYALGGGLYEMEKNIFMLSPYGVEVL